MKKDQNGELTRRQRRILIFRRMCDALWVVVDAIGAGHVVDANDPENDEPYFGLAMEAESLAMRTEGIIEQLEGEERRKARGAGRSNV